MKYEKQTVANLVKRIRASNAQDFSALEHALLADTRLGVQQALAHKRRQLERAEEEQNRTAQMYAFERSFSPGLILGLDEVGRGPVAGPLTVAGVILPETYIVGLNDSKKLSASKRQKLSAEITQKACAWSVFSVDASEIDSMGIMRSLRKAFLGVIEDIQKQGWVPDCILLDGNPLHLDSREVNIVGGDSRCASIAAASIVAKVHRDAFMVEMAKVYPGYAFEKNKGYGSREHEEAIHRLGLSPIHRTSYCSGFFQETLF